MTGLRMHCGQEGRREAVLDQLTINGLDYLEVAADQLSLDLSFIHPLPGEAGEVPPGGTPLTANNVRIEGGVSAVGIRATSVAAGGKVLRVTVDRPGDFSTYTLRLVTSTTDDGPPTGFDRRLSELEFSFKIACPSDFDCKDARDCPPELPEEPAIDYLAKDYASFRQLMLDRMSVVLPDWKDRSPADLQVALVELLAYVGDHLSYFQDAVATEAYLGTARQRVSLRRHARLLDYRMHEGCNARAWIHLDVDAATTLPAGTRFSTWSSAPLVFEAMHSQALDPAHNEISFYTWDDDECCLAAGSTAATLLAEPALSLANGDVLIFEEIRSPTTGLAGDAERAHRHAVRLTEATAGVDELRGVQVVEIAWHERDALPSPLCLSARVAGAGGTGVAEISVARGNVVLADLGETTAGGLEPSTVPESGRYRPRLRESDVTFATAYDHKKALQRAAAGLLLQDPRAALPQATLRDADDAWSARADLLASDRFATEFVVEVDDDRRAFLRFGDDVLGRSPLAGQELAASYRVGNGTAGNVGAEAIRRTDFPGVRGVRNPLPAMGGTAPEHPEEVRQYAPQAFRTQERAVTENDYAEKAEQLDGVQKAAARFRWTGSWYTVFVTVDREGGLSATADELFAQHLRRHLGKYRMAGYDVEIRDPVFVPLDVELLICVDAAYFGIDVRRSLVEALSARDLSDGRRGFFHPDNFTFGDRVYVSRLYAAAMAVEGVASVEVRRFQRWGKKAAGELRDGFIAPADLEIVRLDNDPSEPENGKLELTMVGGI